VISTNGGSRKLYSVGERNFLKIMVKILQWLKMAKSNSKDSIELRALAFTRGELNSSS
jgi:hypothetical protein